MSQSPHEKNRDSKGHTKPDVYSFLKKKIADFEFRPGESLNELLIASSMNVSRTPVRQAFQKLERDGLITLVPNRGASVRILSVTDILEIFQIRNALEGEAARLAAQREVDKTELLKWETFYSQALRKNWQDDLLEFYGHGKEFHAFMIRSGNNSRIQEILENLNIQLELSRVFFLCRDANGPSSRPIESSKEHLAIIEAVRRKDANLAERAMRDHISKTQQYTLMLTQHTYLQGVKRS